jgi:hypothetical protein
VLSFDILPSHDGLTLYTFAIPYTEDFVSPFIIITLGCHVLGQLILHCPGTRDATTDLMAK